MFAAVYRWRVHPGEEAAFQEGWERLSIRVQKEFGSLGSRLHRSPDGTYMSYARWHHESDRLAYRDHYRVDPIGFRLMHGAITEELPSEEFTIVGDLLDDAGLLPVGLLVDGEVGRAQIR
ncbi:antibiotic biosynthesis monooxygenase family protein [Kitasatospora sp. HPMI-4]|uniref:antibiotic biosynthesis monooxygenase family protein n=1 Tax=Kitasatospora sp. HPMI-4 TaxID=3448443 RepID=UPI003F1ADE3E